jgi:hypothetical protein
MAAQLEQDMPPYGMIGLPLFVTSDVNHFGTHQIILSKRTAPPKS